MANDSVNSVDPVDVMNQKISSLREKPLKISKELEDNLKSAAKAFKAKSYTTAAKYFSNFLNTNNSDGKYLNTNDETIDVITYMYCLCSIESSNSKNLWDALELLEKCVKRWDSKYPMFYYAIGKAYFKLYRFSKAAEVISKCYDLFGHQNADFVTYYIPGSEEIIPESTKKGLLAAVTVLKNQCCSWRRADAVCCLTECSNFSSNEAADRNIFFGSPTFIGMVKVTCNNPCNNCTMCFHLACWKAKKESFCSTGKIPDKDVLHMECFTPNCVDGEGVRSTIKKIEIFDDEASVKATIESRGNDAVKHVKSVSTPKGAIKKQQNQPKPRNLNEPRAPVVRHPKPPVVQKEIVKVEAGEEEDDLQDEQTLKAAVDKLKILRDNNFGMKEEKIWRPNLTMYGNEFMQATAEGLPDPEFSNNCPEDEEKAFVFSYFFEFISKNGPMKLSRLDEKWKETQAAILRKPCEFITERHVDLADFLTQSLKFATVGDYICTADKLPEAYQLAKNDACEILKFFMESDVDGNSTASSLDDEAAYNDFINQKHNNTSMSNSTITNDAQSDNGKTNSVPDALSNDTNGFDETRKTVQAEERPEFNEPVICSPKPVTTEPSPNAETIEKTVHADSSATIEKFQPLVGKNTQISSHSSELPGENTGPESAGNNAAEIQEQTTIGLAPTSKTCHSPKATIEGAYSVSDIENHLKCTQPKLKMNEPARETQLTDHLRNRNALIDTARKTSVTANDCGDSEKRLTVENERPSVTDTETVDRSEAVPMGNNIPSESENDSENLKFIIEIQRLTKELTESRKEKEELSNDLSRLHRKTCELARNGALKNLELQSEANQRRILAALIERDFLNKLIVEIQKILLPTIHQELQKLRSELGSNIGEIIKLLNNQKAILMEVKAKISSGCPPQTWGHTNFEAVQIPSIPKFDLSDVLRSAFEMYSFHKWQKFQSPPTIQGQPACVAPHAAQIPLHGHPNVHDNPIIFSQGSHMNSMQPRNPASSSHAPQYYGHPLMGLPMAQTPHLYDQQQNTTLSSSPLPFQPSYPLPSLRPGPLPANHSKNPPTTEQPKLPSGPTTQVADQGNNESSTRPSITTPIRQPNTGQDTVEASQGRKNSSERSINHGIHEKNAPGDFTPQSSIPSRNPTEWVSKIDTSTMENVPSTSCQSMQNNAVKVHQAKSSAHVTRGHSLDKLMRRLRSHYTGVLELDLLKSIELVRKSHNNSLSKLSIGQIINEATRFITPMQQKQLCGYSKYQPNQNPAVRTPTQQHQVENERTYSTSASSSSLPTPSKKGPTVFSKKQWEPVLIPNDKWINDADANSNCVICIDTMSTGETCTLGCKHVFHKQCIRDWHKEEANAKSVVGSCPVCRNRTTIGEEFPPLRMG